MRSPGRYRNRRQLFFVAASLILLSACSKQVNDYVRLDRFKTGGAAPSLAYAGASSDLIDTSNATGFTINGTCSAEGKPVVITGAANVTVTCTGGTWSAVVDASSAADGMLNFLVNHAGENGNAAQTVSLQFPKDTTTTTTATFTKADARIAEASTTTSFNVQLSAAKLYDTVLNYVVSGSAVAGTDHALTNGTITIPAGQTSATVNFNILNNAIVQSERRLAISLTQSNRKSVPVGAVADYFLDIADDDSGAYHTLTSYSSGTDTMCLIFEDNKLKCWGKNTYGQVGDGTTTPRSTPVPIDATTSYAQVTTGGGPSTCARTVAGTVNCWGWNGGAQLGDGSTTSQSAPVLSNGGATFLTIAGGPGPHYCGITTANKLRCWGYNNNGQIGDGSTSTRASGVLVDSGLDYAKVATGDSHSCAITSSGVLKCWGDNTYGQIGDGTTTQRTSPVVIDAGTFYSAVSLGYSYSCAVTTAGQLKCWGNNASGQLGDGTTTQRTTPTAIDTGVTYAVIVSSKDFNGSQCGITTTGVLKCWGSNLNSQVGDGTTTMRTSPIVIDAGTSYVSLSSGRSSTCGLTTTGILKCWGSNGGSPLVQPYTSALERLPVSLHGGMAYTSIARGLSHTCGVLTNGKLRCWGTNDGGQLGDGTTYERSTPTDIDSATTYAKISGGTAHTCGLTTSGKIRCWGSNSYGQVGDGTTTTRLTAVTVDGSTNYTQIIARDNSTCGITTAGILKCWGDNTYGQIGDGTTTSRSTPTIVNSGTTYKAATISTANGCGVTTGKVLKCWGANSNGQLGNGTTTASLVPIVVDSGVNYATVDTANVFDTEQHVCAITDAGVLKCWGSNYTYQVGDGTTTDRSLPVVIDAGVSYASVTVTYGASCATTAAGVAKCWGSNTYGQLGIGAAATSATPAVVDAGVTYSSVVLNRRTTCGLATGALKCWGETLGDVMGRGDRYRVPTPMARIFEP